MFYVYSFDNEYNVFFQSILSFWSPKSCKCDQNFHLLDGQNRSVCFENKPIFCFMFTHLITNTTFCPKHSFILVSASFFLLCFCCYLMIEFLFIWEIKVILFYKPHSSELFAQSVYISWLKWHPLDPYYGPRGKPYIKNKYFVRKKLPLFPFISG